MLRIRSAIVLASLLVLLAGCDRVPAEPLAAAAVASRLDNGQTQRVAIADFTKVDGQASEVFKIQMYTMRFTAAAQFTEDAYYTTGGSIMEPEVRIKTTPASEPPQSCLQNLGACFSQTPKLAHKGDRIQLAGSVAFEQRESGWHATSVSISILEPAGIPDHTPVPVAAKPTPPPVVDLGLSKFCSLDPADTDGVVRLDTGGYDTFVGDAYYQNGSPAAAELSFGGWGDHYYDYLKFEIPQQYKMAPNMGRSSLLCLFATKVPPNDPQLQVAAVTQPWNANTLSLLARPSQGKVVAVAPVHSGWNAIDISTIASSWMTGEAPNNGVVIFAQANNQTNGAFASGDAQDANTRPRLVFPR